MILMIPFPLYERASADLNVGRQEVLTVVSTRVIGRISNIIMNTNGHSQFFSSLYISKLIQF